MENKQEPQAKRIVYYSAPIHISQSVRIGDSRTMHRFVLHKNIIKFFRWLKDICIETYDITEIKTIREGYFWIDSDGQLSRMYDPPESTDEYMVVKGIGMSIQVSEPSLFPPASLPQSSHELPQV